MSKFDVKTGDPPPKGRYRITYRARPVNTSKSWIEGSLEVISRSPEDARQFAGEIIGDNRFVFKIDTCEAITEE